MSGVAIRVAWVSAWCALGCGGGATPIAQTSTPVANPERATAVGAERSTNVVARERVPAASDPNERIVYLRAGAVWIMSADAAEPTQLTIRASGSPDESPQLSPKGDRIAYVSARDGARKIYVTSIHGTETRAITSGADGGDAEPTWSPDGTRLAFMRGDPRERKDLYVVSVDGGEPTLVLEGNDNDPTHSGTPAWSPAGEVIALAADRRENLGTGLWLVRVDGSGLRRLTPPLRGAWYAVDWQPAWSPDGARLVFASNRHVASADDSSDFDIYSVGAGGEDLRRLTSDAAVAYDPTWSPDGQRVFFVSTRDAQNAYEQELYVMPADGGEQRRVTRDARPQNSAPSAGRIAETIDL